MKHPNKNEAMRKIAIILILALSVSCALAGQGNRNQKTKQDTMSNLDISKKMDNGKAAETTARQDSATEKKRFSMEGNDTSNTDQSDKGLKQAKDSMGNNQETRAGLRPEDNDSTSIGATIGQFPPGNTPQDNDSSGLISWIAMLMSMGTLAYLILNKRKAVPVREYERTMSQSGISRNEFNQHDTQINALRRDLQNLTQRVAALSGSTTQQTWQRQQGQQMQQGQQTTRHTQGNETRPQTVTLYASMVRDGEFLAMGISNQRTEEAAFVITVNGNEGTYVVNNDPQVQPRLLASVKYSVGNAADVEAKASPARQIVTVKPGKVVRNGDAWRIVSRAYVELR